MAPAPGHTLNGNADIQSTPVANGHRVRHQQQHPHVYVIPLYLWHSQPCAHTKDATTGMMDDKPALHFSHIDGTNHAARQNNGNDSVCRVSIQGSHASVKPATPMSTHLREQPRVGHLIVEAHQPFVHL